MNDWIYVVLIGVVLVISIVVLALINKKNKKKKTKNINETIEPKEDINLPIKEEIVHDEVKKEELKEDIKEEKEKKPIAKTKEAKKIVLGKYTISYDPTDNNYRYRLYASNGELLITSEIYSSIDGAKKGIETLKNNAKKENIEIVEDKHSLFSFQVFTEKGNRCIATSANYNSKQRIELTLESFLKNVVTDKVTEEEKDDHDEIEEFKDAIEELPGGKLRVYQENDEYFYALIANNGKIIATSQGYKTKKSALNSLERMRELVYTGKFFIYKDKNSRYQFKLYNDKMRMMLAGEIYDTKAKVNSVITSIKRFYRLAIIEEV